MKLGDFIPASIVHQKPDVTSVGFGLQVKGQPGRGIILGISWDFIIWDVSDGEERSTLSSHEHFTLVAPKFDTS